MLVCLQHRFAFFHSPAHSFWSHFKAVTAHKADKERHEWQLQGNCFSWITQEREGVQQLSQDAEKAERELEEGLHEKRQHAAATIQASWSRFRRVKRQRMAVWLQTMVRCRLQQQEFLRQCRATSLIQRSWISYKTHKASLTQEGEGAQQDQAEVPDDAKKAERELEERQLEEREHAAATIQASWSRFRRVKRQRMAVWLQTMVRCRLQQQEFLRQCRATRLIQRSWISYKTHKASLTQEGEGAQQDQAEVPDDAKKAERELEERQLEEREHAAATIQASWSRFRRVKRQRMAVWLQTMVRCRLQQQEFLRQCRATRLIQRSWISYKTHKASLTQEGEGAQQDQAEVPDDAKKAERELEERQLEEREHAAATIQASWSRFRRVKRQRMAVWLQTMVRCRLQQQEFLRQCCATRLSQKAVSLVAGIAQDVDCFSNGSRDTTASEEETKVFKPKCDAWACARCGLVNEVSPDICVLCEGPKPLRRSSLAHRAKQRRARWLPWHAMECELPVDDWCHALRVPWQPCTELCVWWKRSAQWLASDSLGFAEHLRGVTNLYPGFLQVLVLVTNSIYVANVGNQVYLRLNCLPNARKRSCWHCTKLATFVRMQLMIWAQSNVLKLCTWP